MAREALRVHSTNIGSGNLRVILDGPRYSVVVAPARPGRKDHMAAVLPNSDSAWVLSISGTG